MKMFLTITVLLVGYYIGQQCTDQTLNLILVFALIYGALAWLEAHTKERMKKK